jgi:hypothetical protein
MNLTLEGSPNSMIWPAFTCTHTALICFLFLPGQNEADVGILLGSPGNSLGSPGGKQKKKVDIGALVGSPNSTIWPDLTFRTRLYFFPFLPGQNEHQQMNLTLELLGMSKTPRALLHLLFFLFFFDAERPAYKLSM